jgi:DNA-binding CsgD family transcriptional regulator
MALWFAEISRDLLQMNLPVLQIQRWHLAYETAAARRGLLDSNGRIQFHDFAAEVRNHYRDFVDFQHRERILSTPKHPLGWLHTIFERPDRSSHPIFHLLLIGFLFGTMKAFVHALPDPDEVESVAKEEAQTEQPRILGMHPTDDALYRNLSISTRQLARILKVSVDTVVSRRRAMGMNVRERRKVLHPAVLRSMEKALAKGGSPPSIAKRFGVSLRTVYRIRRESLPLLEAHKRMREQEECRKRRLQWQRAVESSAGRTVTAIRRKRPALYAWLYRHDKARLVLSINHHTADSQRDAATIVDWDARDQKTIGAAKGAL